MEQKKPVNLRNYLNGLLILTLLGVLAWNFIIPHSLEKTMPEFDPNSVTHCNVFCYESEVIPPLTVNYTDYEYAFEPGSREYDGLMELLQSEKYRKQFGSLFNDHTRSITLEPDAAIYLTMSDGRYFEIRLLGTAMVMGSGGHTSDYSPTGGLEFQQSVVDYIFEHGTLIKKETR